MMEQLFIPVVVPRKWLNLPSISRCEEVTNDAVNLMLLNSCAVTALAFAKFSKYFFKGQLNTKVDDLTRVYESIAINQSKKQLLLVAFNHRPIILVFRNSEQVHFHHFHVSDMLLLLLRF